MNTTELLSMTSEELMNAPKEIKEEYRNARLLEFHNKVSELINNGAEKVFCKYHTVLVRKNKNGIFYSARNGRGTGKDIAKSSELSDITKVLFNCGSQDVKG